MAIIERIKFYADTPDQTNKYFCFNGYGLLHYPQYFERFWSKGWRIRAAWIESFDPVTNRILTNIRCNNLDHFETEFHISRIKKRTPQYTKVSESLQ